MASAKTPERTGSEVASEPVIDIIHFADPFCWWSWGLEPILHRLKEVYGDQIEVTYRMGGMADKISQWRKDYDVADDKSLKSWITDSMSITGVPVDPNFIVKSSAESSWPACVAFKAAELQNKELAATYFRRLMEAIQLKAKNVSEEDVYLSVAKEVSLDAAQMSKDISSGKAANLFGKDREEMNVNFMTLVIMNRQTKKSKVIEGVFTSEQYENAVDELSGKNLNKKTPIDVLEYFEHNPNHLISAKEIAVVFGISEFDAERRLGILSEGHLLKPATIGGDKKFWTATSEGRNVKELTMEQLNASHITDTSKTSLKTDFGEVITKAVTGLYTQVALHPDKPYHFPLGKSALLFVGYPELEINKLPESALESFAGVGYPHASNAIKPGETVLDIGSGSGTDVLFSSLRTGPKGNVIGLDITDAMIEKARMNIAKMGAKNVKIMKGDANKIPLGDSSIDVVTSNGVLNLVPDKKKAFQEIYRVLKRGGRIQIADIVVQKDVQKACGLIPQLWADCVGGASVEQDYLQLIRDSGLKNVKILSRLDYFAGSSSDNTKRLTSTFGAETIVVTANKPA